MKRAVLAALAGLLVVDTSVVAETVRVELQDFPIMKSVFGQVQSGDIVPARARIGGTVVEILVDEGDPVAAGETIASIVDEKLALRFEAVDARQSALSAQLDNASANLARAEQLFTRGTIAKSRLDELKTQFDVLTNEISALEADKAVIVQQADEGTVIAPASGRILSVPVTDGSVILPGETVARIAGGKYFLRLALPERHAGGITEGDTVLVGARGLAPESGASSNLKGIVAKVYPEIVDGRVTADVDVDGLGDFFVGERTLVSIPVGVRQVLAVPNEAIRTRHGLDYVSVIGEKAEAEIIVVVGETFTSEKGPLTEILTGLRSGDLVITP